MSASRTAPRTWLRVLVFAAVVALTVVLPTVAGATHFTGTTKTCAAQDPVTQTFSCTLNVSVDPRGFTQLDPLMINISPGVTGAEFAVAPTRTGGTCAATTVTLVNPTTVRVSPVAASLGGASCTIVLQETLTADAFGQVCQTLDTFENAPTLVVCAQLVQPLLPTTKELCKNGVWEAFLVFKNQGDCVSFVATGGKNEPGQNVPNSP